LEPKGFASIGGVKNGVNANQCSITVYDYFTR